ncbi:MAG: hypothetical protein ACLFVO_17645 [Chloroflexaceae bacterium]
MRREDVATSGKLLNNVSTAGEGMLVRREDVATLSPYLTQHIKRFGDYQIEGLNDLTVTEEDTVPPLELHA